MKLPKQFDVQEFCRFIEIRRGIEALWAVVSKPIKFPKPRRRGDPTRWPKAA